jgi:phosphosulfolactate synthase
VTAILEGLVPLPARSIKPRSLGLTHVVDVGLSRLEAEGLMELAAAHVDVVRLGWGSAVVTAGLERKLDVYRAHGVAPMFGGTLTELVWRHGRVERFVEALKLLGIRHIEVASGTLDIPMSDMTELIAGFAPGHTVFAEVGAKESGRTPDPGAWVDSAASALEAGAGAVILEGRVSGDAGLYDERGAVREALVEALVDGVGVERLIFEAPRRSQQAWFVRRFGPDVNLGNVLPGDVISLESLRRGLRSDTLMAFHE